MSLFPVLLISKRVYSVNTFLAERKWSNVRQATEFVHAADKKSAAEYYTEYVILTAGARVTALSRESAGENIFHVISLLHRTVRVFLIGGIHCAWLYGEKDGKM